MSKPRKIRPQIALEMTMQDVLGNMAELAMDFGFRDMGGEFEILSIEPSPYSPREAVLSSSALVKEILSAEVALLVTPQTPQKIAI